MKCTRYAITIFIFFLVLTVPAYAHKVTVFAWLEGQTVHTESKFNGGKKVKNGKIEVYDDHDNKIQEGNTDDQGYFTFPVPKSAQSLKIVLIAGMGHSNHWIVSAEELDGKATVQKATPVDQTVNTNSTSSMDPNILQAIVERAVEKKLAPIKAQLAAQAWGLRDVIAGLGYILGLMGLASYVHHRKPQHPKVK